MKKVAFLMTLVLALPLVITRCSKDDDDPMVPQQTLEQKYPDWKNLTWIATDNNPDVEKYPKLQISISGDLVTVVKKLTPSTSLVGKYTQANISSSTATFSSVYQDYNGTGSTLTCTNVSVESGVITLTCLGNTYMLQIN